MRHPEKTTHLLMVRPSPRENGFRPHGRTKHNRDLPAFYTVFTPTSLRLSREAGRGARAEAPFSPKTGGSPPPATCTFDRERPAPPGRWADGKRASDPAETKRDAAEDAVLVGLSASARPSPFVWKGRKRKQVRMARLDRFGPVFLKDSERHFFFDASASVLGVRGPGIPGSGSLRPAAQKAGRFS